MYSEIKAYVWSSWPIFMIAVLKLVCFIKSFGTAGEKIGRDDAERGCYYATLFFISILLSNILKYLFNI
jgi:hypothetical protein